MLSLTESLVNLMPASVNVQEFFCYSGGFTGCSGSYAVLRPANQDEACIVHFRYSLAVLLTWKYWLLICVERSALSHHQDISHVCADVQSVQAHRAGPFAQPHR